MNDKELRKLSRKELLEMLLEQTKRIEELEFELEKVKLELGDRKLSLKNVGTLAEASLVLSDIFKAADDAVNIYIKNVKELSRKEEIKTRKKLKQEKFKEFNKLEKSDNFNNKDIIKEGKANEC